MKDPQEIQKFEAAELLFDDKNYNDALPLYAELQEKFSDEPILNYKLGVCYLFNEEGWEKAESFLEKVDPEKFKDEYLYFYLGRAYHLNYKFDEAVKHFNTFIEGKVSEQDKDLAKLYLNYCINGKEYLAAPVQAEIVNIGSPVNTKNSEYVPVISSDEGVLIYTYVGERSTGGRQNVLNQPDPAGEYYEDVFISYRIDGKWLEPENIGENINTRGHDAAIALSNDGQKLFVFKSTVEDGGDIYVSRLDGIIWYSPEKLKGDVNTSSWEGSASLSSDERTLYFSSERPEGFGGRDIYTATLQEDGSWGNVKNLGERINTPYDDDGPFIHPNGRTLHFSSKGHKSMGDYDVFRADMQIDSSWSEPKNLGYPINTTNRDLYYVLTADGLKGYYSSGKTGGNGRQDIYKVTPGVIEKIQPLILVKGIITVDDKPVKAEIVIMNPEGTKQHAVFTSNSSTGKYLLNLPGGVDYKLIIKSEGFIEEQLVSAANLSAFQELLLNKRFLTPGYLKRLKFIEDSLAGISANDPNAKFDFSNFANSSAPGLTYGIQVGAYNFPDNFIYSSLKPLGEVEKRKLDDGITRFLIGRFNTLNEATAFKKKVIEKGVTDAFTIAIYNGKRMLLKELVEQKIIKPQ